MITNGLMMAILSCYLNYREDTNLENRYLRKITDKELYKRHWSLCF